MAFKKSLGSKIVLKQEFGNFIKYENKASRDFSLEFALLYCCKNCYMVY